MNNFLSAKSFFFYVPIKQNGFFILSTNTVFITSNYIPSRRVINSSIYKNHAFPTTRAIFFAILFFEEKYLVHWQIFVDLVDLMAVDHPFECRLSA